jgi:hypothetical protein
MSGMLGGMPLRPLVKTSRWIFQKQTERNAIVGQALRVSDS